MQLPQDIIFHQVQIKFKAHYVCKIQTLEVGRPLFFDEENPASFNVVVLDRDIVEDMAGLDVPPPVGCLLICAGLSNENLTIPGCSVISVEEGVSFSALFNLLQDIFNKFDLWDAQLTRICRDGGTFQDLIDCTESVLFDPISLMDMAFHYIAYCSLSLKKGLVAKHVDAQGNVPSETVNDWVISNVYAEISQKTGVFSFAMNDAFLLCCNVYYDNNVVGRLAIRIYDKSESAIAYHSPLLAYLAQAVAKLYRFHGSFSQNEDRRNSLRRIILAALDEKGVGPGLEWEEAISQMGWAKEDMYLLVQFRPNSRYDKNIYGDYLTTEIERRWQGCICFEYQGRLMMLVNKDQFSVREETQLFRQALAHFLRESLLVAGVSREIHAWKDLYPAYKQVETAIEIGVVETPTRWLFSFDNYALLGLLRKGYLEFGPEYVCSEKLLLLKEHDEQKNTEYYKTLKTYFLCRFNASATAKKLYIHRSSFLNRLERIQEISKISLDSVDEWLYLAISFKIMEKKSPAYNF